MAHARQLLNILEDEQPPAAPTPEAKPNTNFPANLNSRRSSERLPI